MPERALALLIAGGQGTRMQASRPGVPKPLVPVAGVALLELGLRRIAAAGVREVWIALRHEADAVRAFAEPCAARLGLQLTALVEQAPLGTIGAAVHLRERARDGCVLALNADLVSAIDLGALLARHHAREADLTIATHDEHVRLKLGEVRTGEGGRVLEYLEKPVKSFRISSGTNVLGPAVLRLLERPEWLGFPALAQRAIAAGLHVLEAFHAEPWLDVNDAQDLVRANELVSADPAAFGLLRSERARS